MSFACAEIIVVKNKMIVVMIFMALSRYF
jgi:hypothetical protein